MIDIQRNENINWLRHYRKAARMTLKQLADTSRVNIRQIQRVEGGESEIGNMTAQNVLALADALGVTSRELINGPEAAAL